MAETKNYNINVMRPAIVRMYENGNRGVITKKICSEMGISETYFEWYKKSIEMLFNAVSEYCRLKNSPSATSEEVGKAHEAIYPVWKSLLSTAEKDKFKKELRVTEHDISNLVGFCQMFVHNKNDVSRGVDDTFSYQQVWAVQTLKQFQKRVETDLGIRIAQVEVLSDAERDFLRAERKILNKWRKAESRIKEIKDERERFVTMRSKMKGEEAIAMIDEQIMEMDAKLETLESNIETFQKEHENLLNPPMEEEKPVEEEKPKKKAKAKKKDDVAAETVVVEKAS